MKNYIFSPSDNMFYPVELKLSYEAANNWPTQAVPVDDAVFIEFTGLPPEGKIRAAGNDGFPVWVNVPPPSLEVLIAEAEKERINRIDAANEFMNGKQWPGKAAMGRLTDAEKKQYNQWLDYLDELEAVDTSSAPVISWPSPPED